MYVYIRYIYIYTHTHFDQLVPMYSQCLQKWVQTNYSFMNISVLEDNPKWLILSTLITQHLPGWWRLLQNTPPQKLGWQPGAWYSCSQNPVFHRDSFQGLPRVGPPSHIPFPYFKGFLSCVLVMKRPIKSAECIEYLLVENLCPTSCTVAWWNLSLYWGMEIQSQRWAQW